MQVVRLAATAAAQRGNTDIVSDFANMLELTSDFANALELAEFQCVGQAVNAQTASVRVAVQADALGEITTRIAALEATLEARWRRSAFCSPNS
jgi:hypothetical protein